MRVFTVCFSSFHYFESAQLEYLILIGFCMLFLFLCANIFTQNHKYRHMGGAHSTSMLRGPRIISSALLPT